MKKNFFSKSESAYLTIMGTVGLLSALGLVVVLSSSSVRAIEESGYALAIAWKQLLFFLIAICSAFLAMKLPPARWLSLARYCLLVSCAFLILPQIPGIGKTIKGNTNWIGLGSFTIQPSEFAKIGLILWSAYQLRIHDKKLAEGQKSEPFGLLVYGFILIEVLILFGSDLGTAIIVLIIFAGILFIAGTPIKIFTFAGAGALGVILLLTLTQQNRMRRFTAFVDPFSIANYKFAGWQPAHSLMGLASGGLFGVGLGASRQKWGGLAEAHTDFIFAIIGEEMGLLGTLTVLLLFGLLIFSIFKVALKAENNFERYVCAGIGCWLAIQVLVNVGVVISVIPVVGVTLPFISYGGSSLVAAFIGIGFVLGVARRNPAVSQILRRRKSDRIKARRA